MKSIFTLYARTYAIIFSILCSPCDVSASAVDLPDSIGCDSLDKIIIDIYENEQTFTDNTQEIADRLLFLAEQKKCKTLPAAYTLLGTINYNLNKPLESKSYLLKAES